MSQVAAFIDRLARKMGATPVTVERATESRDGAGSTTKTWAQHLTLDAVIQIRSGQEAVRYGRENNRAFGIAYLPPGQDVTEKDRVIYDSRTFDIQSVRVPDERADGDSLAYMIVELEETD